MSGAAGRGAAAAALIVILGSTAPAFAVPWAGPSLHGGESAGSASGTDPGHAAEDQMDSSDQAEHEGSHRESGAGSHDSHDAGTGADDAHQEHDDNASGHDGHDASAGAAGSDASAGSDGAHDSHDGDASSGHGDAASEHSDASTEHGDDGGHGGEPDTVSQATKTRVLGGFGVVNAAAVGGAFLLRRRDRESTTNPGRVRGSRRDHTRRTR